MAVPNFNSTTQPVYGQDTLSSGAGTVAPQQMAKPAIQKPAQELARRILPTFNNGNPRGSNNMPSRNWWDQPQANRNLMYQGLDRNALDQDSLRQFEAGGGVLPRFGSPQRPSEQTTGWYQDRDGNYGFNDPGQRQRGFNRDDLVVGRRNADQYSNLPMLPGVDPNAVRANPEGYRRFLEQTNGQGFGYQQQGGNDGTYRPGNANYYGGQSAGAGRYRPPTMDERGQWQDQGGYNYNLPNAFGSYPGYGQGNPWSQRLGPGYEGLFDFMPQFLPYGGG